MLRQSLARLCACAILLGPGALAAHAIPAAPACAVDAPVPAATRAELSIGGAVEHPHRYAVADLELAGPRDVKGLAIVCGSGATKGTLDPLHGVLLRALLERASIKAPAHDSHNRMYILATASDGYQALFSWHEIFNAPAGDGIMVIYNPTGAPITARAGRIALVSTTDLRDGPRYVHNLVKVDVIDLPARVGAPRESLAGR